MNDFELRDIHLPDDSLWWPPAPGWWLLLLLLIAIALISLWLKRRNRFQPLKQMSLQELKRIRQNFAAGQGSKVVLADVSALLRRILISYHGRDGYAGSTGETWRAQLTSLSVRHGFSPAQLEMLANTRYQREVDCDVSSLLQDCENWIRSIGQAHVSD